MVAICQKCGDHGFDVALIYCDTCQVSAEHRYCLNVLPETFDEYVTWLCEDCKSEVPEPTVKRSSSIPSINGVGSRAIRACRLKRLKMIEKKKPVVIPLTNKKARTCEETRSLEPPHTTKDPKARNKTNATLKNQSNVNEGVECNKEAKKACEEKEKSGKLRKSAPKNGASSNISAPLLVTAETPCIAQQSIDAQISGKHTSSTLSDKNDPDDGAECSKTKEIYEEDGKPKALRSWSVKNSADDDEEAESSKISSLQFATVDRSCITQKNPDVPAQPILDATWRGSFSIGNENFGNIGGLAAHLSTKACTKVQKEAKLLPDLLCLDLVSRSDAWPKSFECLGPRDHDIALYFFPESERDERAFDKLVEDMIDKDFAMRAVAENAELLVFTSTQLPLAFWRFQAKYYLWGVFRGKPASSSQQLESQQVVQSDCTTEEKAPRRTKSWDTWSPLSPLSDLGSLGQDV